MMKCLDVKEKLVLIWDGDLPNDERQEIEDHLNQCSACEGEREALRNLLARYRRVIRHPRPANQWARLEKGDGRIEPIFAAHRAIVGADVAGAPARPAGAGGRGCHPPFCAGAGLHPGES